MATFTAPLNTSDLSSALQIARRQLIAQQAMQTWRQVQGTLEQIKRVAKEKKTATLPDAVIADYIRNGLDAANSSLAAVEAKIAEVKTSLSGTYVRAARASSASRTARSTVSRHSARSGPSSIANCGTICKPTSTGLGVGRRDCENSRFDAPIVIE